MTESNSTCNWLCTGDEVFPAMLAEIDAAKKSVCLEVYVFTDSPVGVRFRDALVRARQRGVSVRVLVDAVGSYFLPGKFWDSLRSAGGEIRQFNPVTLKRLIIRNHRKLLVCDGRVAFVGGFNIATEYEGDGVKSGWCDVGLKIEGALVAQLESSFDEMFGRADFRHKRFMPLRKSHAKKVVALPKEQLLFSGPGRGRNPFKRALHGDLKRAKNVQMIIAYFLPTWRLRRELMRVARRGGKVRLILAGKSDVLLSMLAAQGLYRRFLKGNIEIYEYQPQILHAKLIVVDDIVYLGSANLDTRSLRINYELMIRFENKTIAKEAREIFSKNLKHCHRVTAEEWRKSRSFWRKLKQRWAYFLLNHLDPYLARRQWRDLPD
ncbi:MAG TPA: phosphatidylserine/phosphatidylglycerophosphate/cardiolipin synthase family protein [Verrucomicrobiae bacterium]